MIILRQGKFLQYVMDYFIIRTQSLVSYYYKEWLWMRPLTVIYKKKEMRSR